MKITTHERERFAQLIKHPTAMVITGPIGSGKTFTAEALIGTFLAQEYSVVWISEVSAPEHVAGSGLEVISGVPPTDWPDLIPETGARVVVIDTIESYITDIDGIATDAPTTDQVLAYCRRLAEETGVRVLATFSTLGDQ